MEGFIGSGVALVTPFTHDGINQKVLGDLIEWQIEQQTDALIVGGTTGEASTMTQQERKDLITYTVEKVAHRIPVIAGSGGNDTESVIAFSQFCESAGVDMLLIVTPYYNKTTQRGLIEHYTRIANSVQLPIILYNVPSRTGLSMSVETVYVLSKIKNIVGIKEASGDLSYIAAIASRCGEGFYIYSGNDDQIIPTLSLGGKGAISATANLLPSDIHNMMHTFWSGDIQTSAHMQLKLKPLVDALFYEVNPIPIKAALQVLGVEVGDVRLPLVPLSDEGYQVLVQAIHTYGLTCAQMTV